jgi:type I restriction enzyme, S subunit
VSTTAQDPQLPEGWTSVALGDVLKPSAERVEPWEQQGAPYLSLEHVESHTNRIVGRGRGADVRSLKSVFRAGDVLYGKLRPYLNKVAVPDFDGICSTDFIVFRPTGYLDPYFLAYFLSRREVFEHANHHASGAQLPRIGLEELGTLQVPLPPRAEQERIAAALRQLFGELDGVRGRIAGAANAVARLRDAIIVEGASGRLTAEWRGKSGGTASAETLLEEVAAGREVKAPIEKERGGLPDGWARVSLGFLAEPTERGQSFVTSGARGWASLVGDVGDHFIRLFRE